MRVLKLIWRTARPYRCQVAAAVLLLTLATLLEVVAFPVMVGGTFIALDPSSVVSSGGPARGGGVEGAFIQRQLDRVPRLRSLTTRLSSDLKTKAGRGKWLFIFAFGGLLIYAIKCLCTWGYLYLNQYVSQHVMKDLRAALYGRMLQLPLSFYESRQTGELMSRMTNDVALVQNLVSVQLADAIVAAVTIGAGLSVLLLIKWQLTVLALMMVPLVSWVIGSAGQKTGRITRRIQQRVAAMNARLQERISTINIVQCFTREQYEQEKFDEINRETVAANLQAARVAAPLQPMVEFIGVLGMIFGIGFAGWYVIYSHLSIPRLVVYFTIVQKVGTQFSKIGRIYLAIQQGIAAGSRVTEVLDREPEVRDLPGASELPAVQGRLALHGVSFRYAESEHVLRDINLVVEPGEIMALVGPSGAGKTSMTKLIPRFYDPSEGWIEIDGHNIREVTLLSLRSQIGLVPQETVLFSGNIRDNIAYGKLDATQSEIEQAAKAANAHDFILSLPKGYETAVGERGMKLSGGQRQRIAIARTVLKNPRLLILDEATSSLDTESEMQVQEALDRLMAGRTTVVIAHRLSTVRNATRIVVLSDGRITEMGSHAELMQQGGLYRRLYEMQFREDERPAARGLSA